MRQMQKKLGLRRRRAAEQPVDPGADGNTGESTSGSRCPDTTALLSRIDEVLASV
ncbi:MAG: hypothetical protein QOE01_826 [Actinomycetota bacterium]|nr:hypothetical protein [Actinomycetota bacterium]